MLSTLLGTTRMAVIWCSAFGPCWWCLTPGCMGWGCGASGVAALRGGRLQAGRRGNGVPSSIWGRGTHGLEVPWSGADTSPATVPAPLPLKHLVPEPIRSLHHHTIIGSVSAPSVWSSAVLEMSGAAGHGLTLLLPKQRRFPLWLKSSWVLWILPSMLCYNILVSWHNWD